MKNTNLFRLAFLLFAGLSIFLSSCQPKEEGDKKYVIGFSQCTSDSWREAVLLEMQIEASNYRNVELVVYNACLLYTSPSPRDVEESRMPSSA